VSFRFHAFVPPFRPWKGVVSRRSVFAYISCRSFVISFVVSLTVTAGALYLPFAETSGAAHHEATGFPAQWFEENRTHLIRLSMDDARPC